MARFGLLNLHKPSGPTSRDIVNQVQRLVKPAKVGHAGTLDPLASGVLVVGIGPATRLLEYVQLMPKTYRAVFLFGRSSPTEDVEGDVTVLADAKVPSRAEIECAARALTGTIMQRPPVYSALKISGQPAYARARAGESVELAPRPVRVDRLEIVRYEYPEICLDVVCGSGTYVRSLGRDLAERLDTSAVMSSLVRTAIGPFTLETTVAPQDLARDSLSDHLLPLVRAVEGLMPLCQVAATDAQQLASGLVISLSGQGAERIAAVNAQGELIAILQRRGEGLFGPGKNLPA